MESLITLLNGDDFLLKKNWGNGQLYFLAVPIDPAYSNFSSNALFVPVLYNAAIQGKSTRRHFYIIGKDDAIETDLTSVPVTETPFSLKLQGSDFSMIPEQKINNGKLFMALHEGIHDAGFYNLTLADSVYRIFAFNFNRSESRLDFLSDSQLKDELSKTGLKYFQVLNSNNNTMSSMIKSIGKENELWKLFIIFALFMLLGEILILRFWK